jgi:hypothetical protein
MKMCLPVQPYKIEREWKHAGLSCAVVQAREGAHRCGYVRVPPGHPLHGKPYEEPEVEVHGGLTFAEIEPCTEHADGQGYWFGFDCAHAGDASYDPNATTADLVSEQAKAVLRFHLEIAAKYPIRHEHYWTESEVVAETERLAEQLSVIVAA